MPIRPGPYEPEITRPARIGGLGGSAARTPGGSSVVPSPSDRISIHAPGEENASAVLRQLMVGASRFVAGMEKAEEERRAIEWDNLLLTAEQGIRVGLDETFRTLKREGIGTEPGGSSRFAEEYEQRARKLIEDAQGRLPRDPRFQNEFARRVLPHYLQARLRAGAYSDELLRADSNRTLGMLEEQALRDAGNLGLPEAPTVPGDRNWAGATAATFSEHLDQMVRNGLIQPDVAETKKRELLHNALFTRGAVMARELPDEVLRRADDPEDPLFSRLDPLKKQLLVTRAEERKRQILRDQQDLREAQRKEAEEQRKQAVDALGQALDIAALTGQDLSGWETTLAENARVLGHEGVTKLADRLNTYRERRANPAPDIPKDVSDSERTRLQARILANRGLIDDNEILKNPRLREDDRQALLTLMYGQRQDERSDWDRQSHSYIREMLGSATLPGIAGRYDGKPVEAAALAVDELIAWTRAHPNRTWAEQKAETSAIVGRWKSVLEEMKANPAKVWEALPRNPATGLPFSSAEEVRRSSLPRWQKDQLLRTIQSMGLLDQPKPESKPEPTPEPKSQPGLMERVFNQIPRPATPKR